MLFRQLNTECGQLFFSLLLPAPVGGGAGGAGVQDAANRQATVTQRGSGPVGGELADADDPLRLAPSHQAAEGFVAGGKQVGLLGGWQFVGGAVAARIFHEHQRAVVVDEELLAKGCGRFEPVASPAPEPSAANLAAAAGKALDWSLGVEDRWLIDRFLNAEEITDEPDLAEGDTGLGHAPGARVHAEQQGFDALHRIP